MAWESETADVVGGETIESSWGNGIRDRTVHGPQTFASLPGDADTGALAFTTDRGWAFKASGGWRVLQYGAQVLSNEVIYGARTGLGDDGTPQTSTRWAGETWLGFDPRHTWTVPDYLDNALCRFTARATAREAGAGESGSTRLRLGVGKNDSELGWVAWADSTVTSGAHVVTTGSLLNTVAAGDTFGLIGSHAAPLDADGEWIGADLEVEIVRAGLT